MVLTLIIQTRRSPFKTIIITILHPSFLTTPPLIEHKENKKIYTDGINPEVWIDENGDILGSAVKWLEKPE